MKISEFEDKLSTVPDAKLRQMLSASRASGPEVAVKLILNECKRRGMDGLDAPAEGAFDRAPGSETTAYPQEAAGYAGADAPPDSHKHGSREGALAAEGEDLDSGAPATAPDWLNEETRSGMPVAVKALLVVVVLAAILGLAWKFTH
jgi:hypothetical protein